MGRYLLQVTQILGYGWTCYGSPSYSTYLISCSMPASALVIYITSRPRDMAEVEVHLY